MFLKRVVLCGFKSFADRTEFTFGPGITGIVGPNGCGKSNVLDSIRWVLGEQSARSLRGGKMSDVIFSGSRSRKPAAYAHVELTFDNRSGLLRNDQEEVSVARFLYANGDSEYRMNGNVCRLKDIRDLLLDTGVGVDAYSVIEQGRVDLLLQASPLERREIFEEAAGISRYKVRRLEAQRKLERTQTNLLRLQDIIEELEKRLRSVRLAAGKARNFVEYDGRLRTLRSSFSMAEYHQLEQRRRSIQLDLERQQDALQEERARLAQQDVAAAELGREVQTLDEQIQAAEAEIVALQTELSTLAERMAQGERRQGELVALRDRRRRQAEEVAGRVQDAAENAAAEAAALEQLGAADEATAARIAAVDAERSAAEEQAAGSRSLLEGERAAAFEAVRRATLLQNEQENLRRQHERLTGRVERLRERQTAVEEERAAQTERLTQSQGELETCSARCATLAGQVQEVDQEIEAARRRDAELRDELSAAKEARSALVSRLTLLQDLERRLEGVDRGAQAVLSQANKPEWEGLIVGLVADLLRSDEPRVSMLQPVLSTFESHLVVRDVERFGAALATLGELPGPVRVLSHERLSRPAALLTYAGVPGVIARALDWVQCAPEQRGVAEHLLGRTIVVENLAVACQLAVDAPEGYSFVTPAGEVVGSEGRVLFSAATQASGHGLISRKTEIRQLELEQDELATQVERLQRAQATLAAQLADAQLRRDAVLAELAQTQRAETELRSRLTRLRDECERLGREAANIESEMQTEAEAAARAAERLAGLSSEWDAADAAQRSHESQVERLGRELAELDAAVRRLTQQYTAALVEKERLVEQRAARERAVTEWQARHASLLKEQAAAIQEADEAEGQIEAAVAEVQAASARHSTQSAVCETRQAEVYELRRQRQVRRAQFEEFGSETRQLQHRIEEFEAAVHESQMAQREAEVRRETLVTRVQEELELDLQALYADYQPEDQDWDAVRIEIDELRGKIARLGNVNLDALQELEELTPRYEHLVGQRTDLQDAIQRLETLVAELDEESRTRFATTFEEVRTNFQELFRKLFGGGKADVILENPEQPLECGIEIIARPPGKEPQSISLLSGGEKTMTAVALLMAVFRSRPSPFTILDEVDAALDEANVDRFNRLLTEFLSTTQFVVITHSKKTMAQVDVLYGITMEEPGVSKRVSVRFDDRVGTPNVA